MRAQVHSVKILKNSWAKSYESRPFSHVTLAGVWRLHVCSHCHGICAEGTGCIAQHLNLQALNRDLALVALKNRVAAKEIGARLLLSWEL